MAEQKTGHTPGPWTARDSGSPGDPRWWVFVKGDTLNTICSTSQGNDEANGRLIAAAPAMLEVLQEMEWQRNDPMSDFCAICGSSKPTLTLDLIDGSAHDKNCKLDATIKAAIGQ